MVPWFYNRFFIKLTMAFCLTVAVTLIVTAALTARLVRKSYIRDLTNNLSVQAQLLADELEPASTKQLSTRMERLAKILGGRVTVIDPQGNVLADSSVPFADLGNVENHKDRPEFLEAMSGHNGEAIRHSHTIDKDLFYVAVPWIRDNQSHGVVRLALLLDVVDQRARAVINTIRKVSFGMIGLAILFALWLSRSISKPIVRISSVIGELAEGNYDVRAPRFASNDHDRLASAVNHLATKIQSVISQLDSDRSQLSSILENMVEAVLAVDGQSRLVWANSSMTQLFNFDEASSRGKPFLETLRHNQLNQLVSVVIGGGRPIIDEVRTFTPTERIFEAHAVPLRNESGLVGALLVLHDITRLRQLEQIRREFVANVSHELRTPLAAMKGYAETLRLGAIDDKENRMEFLQSIETQAENLTRLVDDLLDLAAIESGKRQIIPEKINLPALARSVAKDLKPESDRRKVKVSIQEGPAGSDPSADSDQIKQVLTNLIDNAIKFNREGGQVTVSFSVKNNVVETSVSDDGVGIPSSDLPRVFERFFRVDKARSREVGGTGLGLAIVKHIVEAHGGRVSVTSQENKGSTFTFHLPLSA